ncbi:MAG: beta-ketoacyl synthase N-terminal-like domain-containing protein [Kiritimatiellia bacterium]
MSFVLSSFFTASALGTGNTETLANYLKGEAPGMREIAGDVPGRRLWFGSVTATLPPAEDLRGRTRTNRLLALAVREMPELRAAVRAFGPARVGIVLGSSNTGVHEAFGLVERWIDRRAADPSAPKPSEFDFSMLELGTPSLYLKELLGVEGPAYTVSTACSSAAKAFAAARRLIACGHCDAVITGGVDGRCRFALNGFHALGALSEGRCRPLAADRDGINLGEGVALFVMTRGDAGVVLAGVGETSDAYHATAPEPGGRGAEAAMRAALADAGLRPADVDYVNLHGTGTPANDAMETQAVGRIWPDWIAGHLTGHPSASVVCESTKRYTGHCLGAAGAVEAAVCALLVQSGLCNTALSNSFAFGGANASIILTA